MRSSTQDRKTKETDIHCYIEIDGIGEAKVDTGIGFFDHILNTLAKHSGFNLQLSCRGDLEVDTHHSVEDCGLVLGKALYDALGERKGIARYSSFTMCMDDALVLCSIDICNRPYYASDVVFSCDKVGDFETQTTDEFFRSLANEAKLNLHFVVLRGENAHHIIEAMTKALAKCLREAVKITKEVEYLTTKGIL